ncbi:MAG: hypothetical protein Kow00128_07600 [Deltaproteobacteria bacterium]
MTRVVGRRPAAGRILRGRHWWTLLLIAFFAGAAGASESRVLTVREGLPSNWVTALAPAPEGKLWVGTGNAGVFLLDPATGTGKGYRTADGLSSDEVTSIALFQGKVYVGTAAGLSVFDGSKWETVSTVENVTMRNVRLAASPDGKELWACAVYLAGGTVRFDGAHWKFMGGEGRGLFNDIQGFAFLPDGVVMGAGSGGVYLHTGSGVQVLSGGLPPANIFAAAGRGKGVLIGTSRGLYEYEGTWRVVPLPDRAAGAPVFSIAVEGERAAAGSDKGLLVIEGGKVRVLGTADGLPAPRVGAVAFVDGKVAAGTARGLAIVPVP